jgi:hypothetical protein
MKTLSIQQFNNLPIGFQESILERSKIQCAITNANTFLTYFRKCQKYEKENPNDGWIECGQNALRPYYNELLAIEFLANKYHLLWQEQFSKTKHLCEKALNINLINKKL